MTTADVTHDVVLPERVIRMGHVMRVKSTTAPQAVAYSIQMLLFDQNKLPVIRAVGAGATHQACKGIAIARGIVAVRGIDLAVSIGFDNIEGEDGKDISAQVFHLFLR